MKLLALDTSTLSCSAALAVDDAILDRYEEKPREHTRLIGPMIRTLLDDAGIKARDLDAIVLGNGPGSFIGLRIAASVAQGLAYASGIGIITVSSLAAVAQQVFERREGERVAVAQDAHLSQVYFALFERAASGLPATIVAPRLAGQGTLAELASADAAAPVAAGDGWRRYGALLAANRGMLGPLSAVRYPSARHLLPLGRLAFQRGEIGPPAAVELLYLREQVATAPKGP